MPSSAGVGLDFYIFLATCKKLKKSNIYISDEAVHNQRPPGQQTTRQVGNRHFTEPPHYRQV